MENKAINHSFSTNGHSLQLRSKEVSEVMGNIPRWIGSWGATLMCLFFLVSILYVINITAVERIDGEALISWQHNGTADLPDKNYFLSVTVSKAAEKMIREKQRLQIYSTDKDSPFYNNNGIVLPVNEITVDKDSCMLKFLLNDDLVKQLRSDSKQSPRKYTCQLETNIKVYKKIFGFLL